MQARGFFSSLFDYSFTSFITPRIIRVLYILATIMIAVWTLLLVLASFNVSSSAGVGMLLVGGPVFFLISMIWARVFLELVIVFFRINGNVQEIRDERIGDAPQPAPIPEKPLPVAAPVIAPVAPAEETGPEGAATTTTVERDPEPAATASSPPESEPAPTRYCENCGAERSPDSRFCTSCGHA